MAIKSVAWPRRRRARYDDKKRPLTMYAVIRTGGKQYRVAADDVLEVERLTGEPGDKIELTDVLLLGGGDGEPQIGAPLVSGAVVAAEVVDHHRGEKIIIFKKKRRQNYRRKRGHRQELTTIRIVDILANGETQPKKQAKAKPAADEGSEAKAEKAPKAKKAPKAEAAKTEE
jgi:large subunit ribosomal protein L21